MQQPFQNFLQSKSVDKEVLLDFAPQSSMEVLMMESKQKKCKKERIKHKLDSVSNQSQVILKQLADASPPPSRKPQTSCTSHRNDTSLQINAEESTPKTAKPYQAETCKNTKSKFFTQTESNKGVDATAQAASAKSRKMKIEVPSDYVPQPRTAASSQQGMRKLLSQPPSPENQYYNLQQIKMSNSTYRDEIDLFLMKRFKLNVNNPSNFVPKYWFSEQSGKLTETKLRQMSCQNALSQCASDIQAPNAKSQSSHNHQRVNSLASSRNSHHPKKFTFTTSNNCATTNNNNCLTTNNNANYNNSSTSHYLKSFGSHEELLLASPKSLSGFCDIPNLQSTQSPANTIYKQDKYIEAQNAIVDQIKQKTKQDIENKLHKFGFYRKVLKLDKVWSKQMKKNFELFNLPSQVIQQEQLKLQQEPLKLQQPADNKPKSTSHASKRSAGSFPRAQTYINPNARKLIKALHIHRMSTPNIK